jgi:hypothetical protein
MVSTVKMIRTLTAIFLVVGRGVGGKYKWDNTFRDRKKK